MGGFQEEVAIENIIRKETLIWNSIALVFSVLHCVQLRVQSVSSLASASACSLQAASSSSRASSRAQPWRGSAVFAHCLVLGQSVNSLRGRPPPRSESGRGGRPLYS